jgi:hypothetical protein
MPKVELLVLQVGGGLSFQVARSGGRGTRKGEQATDPVSRRGSKR